MEPLSLHGPAAKPYPLCGLGRATVKLWSWAVQAPACSTYDSGIALEAATSFSTLQDHCSKMYAEMMPEAILTR